MRSPNNFYCQNSYSTKFQAIVLCICCLTVVQVSVTGKLITAAKIVCLPSSEAFHLAEDELVPTPAEEGSEDEDEDMEEPDVTELETEQQLDSDTQPMKAAS